MNTNLIRLSDGTLVEIALQSNDQVEQISGRFAKSVKTAFDEIVPILTNVCRPVITAWKELDKDMFVEQAEIELCLGFEGEGNLYITKTKANANLTVTLTLKPSD